MSDDALTRKPTNEAEIKLEELFPDWVAMGSRRLYPAFAKLHNIDLRALVIHSQKFHWRERLGEIAAEANAIAGRRMAEGMANTKLRHLEAIRILMDAAVRALTDIPIEKPADAINALKVAINLERETLDMGNMKDVDVLTDLLAQKVKELVSDDADADLAYELDSSVEDPLTEEIPGEAPL